MSGRVLALSTMWGIERFPDTVGLIQKSRDMGFSHVEINYQVTSENLCRLKSSPGLAVSSIHSPCPGVELPDGRWTYRLRMTADDEEESSPALAAALRSIDTAVAFGAPLVVLHVGSVPLQDGLERRLRELYKAGVADGPEFRSLRDRLIEDRNNRKPPYIESAVKNLRRLASYARERGVRIGLESRYYFHEIPSLEEVGLFLDEFGDTVGYWHDFGHCENLARLGFAPHQQWLDAYSTRMIGTHIHDIALLADHKAPGRGTLDLKALAGYIPQDAARVCEIASSNTEAEVRAGMEILREAGII